MLLQSRNLEAFSLCIVTDASESAYVLEVRVLRDAIAFSHQSMLCEACKSGAIGL